MARGGRKTPPNNRSPIVTRSHSDNNVTLETTNTSNNTPDIPIELITPVPQGIDVQEIVRQTIIRTQTTLSCIR
jgi:hypothetical protein